MNYFVKGTVRQEVFLDVDAGSQEEAERIARETPASEWGFCSAHPVGLIDVREAELDD
jgi:hypothetical protein